MKAIFTLLFSILSLSSFAQTVAAIDTVVYGGFIGKETYSFIQKDSLKKLNGKYSFVSDQKIELNNDSLQIKQLNINGNHLNNEKNGIWNYHFSNFLIDALEIKGTRNFTLSHSLNGKEDEFIINYQRGNFSGKSIWIQKNISKGRVINEKQLASIFFKNDTLSGPFAFDVEGIQVKGQTNAEGFLDGIVEMIYVQENIKTNEKRTYSNGFLLELEKTNVATNEKLIKITYRDVIDKIENLSQKKENLNYKMSENYFGIHFNLGYQQSDKRVTEQLFGNDILEKYFLLCDSINNLHIAYSEQKTVLKLTRRFQFIYDVQEDLLATQLFEDLKTFKTELQEFLNKPNLMLRKNNSDSLFYRYEMLKHIYSKLEIIQDVLTKNNSGYFDFRYRNRYYEKGVPGIDRKDTINFTFKNISYQKPFELNQKIDSPDSLFYNLHSYLAELKRKTVETKVTIQKSLALYENQDMIDSLDVLITKYHDSLEILYSKQSIYEKEDVKKIPFSYKTLFSLNDRMLDQLEAKYLNNSLPQDEMISVGKNIVCYYQFLIENKSSLANIGEMKKYWNDSMFTVYRDNPFDVRKLESKILDGVQNSANILLTYYANQLLNAKNCEQLLIELQKINKLNERINYLVKNQESNTVQQLNKTLRRERVPSRIERILELQ